MSEERERRRKENKTTGCTTVHSVLKRNYKQEDKKYEIGTQMYI
jgi:hypothetical protein